MKFFPEIVRDLRNRHIALFGRLDDATISFVKGNLSDSTMEELIYSSTHFVAGMKAERFPDIFAVPIDRFEESLKMPGTKFYEATVELCGKKCKAVVSYSESFFMQQLASLTATMTKCQDKLKELQCSLLS